MVVLVLKNLQQETFEVDVDLASTVKELKEKIEKDKGTDYPAGGQKLIYAGKILQDGSTLESYNIDAKKFLVIMVVKAKAPPPPSAPPYPAAIEPAEVDAENEATTTPTSESVQAAGTTTQSSTTSSSSSSTTTTSTPTSSQSTTTTTTTTTPSQSAASGGILDSAESLVVMGEEFNRMVESIMEMGYERPQVERALRASFNNPYTAVTYLVDGIPPNLEADPPPATGGNPPPTSGSGGGGGGGGEEELAGEVDDANDPLSFLRTQPQFTQMRQMIRSNPQLLDAFIQQIGQTNPELLQLIQQNQEEFVRMLNEGNSGSPEGGNQGSGGGGGGTGGSSGRAVPGQNAILVSPSDRDAIERLKALGNFPEDVVIQAYFACEKNENLAAEFLFSQTWD